MSLQSAKYFPEHHLSTSSSHIPAVLAWEEELRKDYCDNPIVDNGKRKIAFEIESRLSVALDKFSCPLTYDNFEQDDNIAATIRTQSYELRQLLNAGEWYRGLKKVLPPSTRPPPIAYSHVAHLEKHWRDEYHGRSLQAFHQKIKESETLFSDADYSKSFDLTQSSGTGKSRMLSELGKSIMVYSFALRKDTDSGFPLGDPEIFHFLMDGPNDANNIHIRALALLGAIIQESESSLSMNLLPCN
jgi:hypothetical protein